MELNRETFKQNRSLEFFSEKELSMQIGHDRKLWRQAILKELIDNSLDACETAGILPEIRISADDVCLTITDNGPGIPEKTIEQSMDYLIRVSDKNFYVAPSRGQLGNALKCLYAVPFVMNGTIGRVDIETGGKVHHIEVSVDQIAQEPILKRTVGTSLVKNGTLVKIYLENITGYIEGVDYGYSYQTGIQGLLLAYSAVNPHASFFYRGDFEVDLPRTTTECSKWTPSNPTSSHWYNIDRLSSLIGAYLANERGNGHQRTVRDFVAEFKWLSSTQKRKAVTNQAGLTGSHLKDLITNGALDHGRISALLDAMQENSKPVKPKGLGMIGEDHIREWMHENFMTANSFKYKRIEGDPGGLPFVLEVAFGVMGGEMQDSNAMKTSALNWTPTLITPWENHHLSGTHCESYDPIHLFIHLACPRLNFTDRGKTRLKFHPEIEDAMAAAIKHVTKEWTAIKKKEYRQDRKLNRERDEMRKKQKRKKMTIKEASFQVMEEAYLKASDNGTLPANARQIMYAARPGVIQLAGKCWKNSSTFTQIYLNDFLTLNPELKKSWDIVYDARGKLIEPHTGRKVEIGTIEVREYVSHWIFGDVTSDVDYRIKADIHTHGPGNRYHHALFVEKEGFNQLFKSVHLAERYDMAIMSTKGMSVTAMRTLVERMSADDVTVLVLHDFDKAGFSIVNTLRTDTKRYSFDEEPNVIDFGFRIDDVKDLETEEVFYDSEVDPRVNMRESGATKEEAEFLRSDGHPKAWRGHRVELNAMTSKQLIDWLEMKLKEHGVKKLVPNENVLKKAYTSAYKAAKIREEVSKIIDKFDEKIEVPEDLKSQIEKSISGTAQSWDGAIKRLAGRET